MRPNSGRRLGKRIIRVSPLKGSAQDSKWATGGGGRTICRCPVAARDRKAVAMRWERRAPVRGPSGWRSRSNGRQEGGGERAASLIIRVPGPPGAGWGVIWNGGHLRVGIHWVVCDVPVGQHVDVLLVDAIH